MAVVSFTSIHPKPGAKWEDTKKHLKKGCDLARKHGAENVTALVGIAAGTATGTVILVYSCADWATYGTYQNAMMADPETAARDGRSERSDRQLGHVPQPDDPGHVTRLQTLPDRKRPMTTSSLYENPNSKRKTTPRMARSMSLTRADPVSSSGRSYTCASPPRRLT